MSIIASEIKYFQSTNNLGGALVATEIVSNTVHNLFDVVPTLGAQNGQTGYRCIYIKNTNATLTLQNAVAFILAATTSTKSTLSIGLGTSAINGVEQTISNKTTAPLGVTFSSAVGFDFGVALGDLAAGDTRAIWLKRVIDADTNATSNDFGSISVQGDTA